METAVCYRGDSNLGVLKNFLGDKKIFRDLVKLAEMSVRLWVSIKDKISYVAANSSGEMQETVCCKGLFFLVSR